MNRTRNTCLVAAVVLTLLALGGSTDAVAFDFMKKGSPCDRALAASPCEGDLAYPAAASHAARPCKGDPMNDDDLRTALAPLRRVPVPPLPRSPLRRAFHAWPSVTAAALLLVSLVFLIASEQQ